MQSNNAQFKLLPWVSWRQFFTPEEKRLFISNEQQREYLLLHNESAELFEAIAMGFPQDYLKNLAVVLQVSDELPDFLESLIAEGLIQRECEPLIERSPLTKGKKAITTIKLEKEMIEWAGVNGFLFGCHLDLTYRCNQKCVHCFNPNALERRQVEKSSTQQVTNELSTIEIYSLMDSLAALGVFHLTLSGGEATLRKDFWELFEYAKKLGFCVELYSNGLNLSECFVKRLKRYWPHKVSISVYSDDPKQHDSITGVQGSWQKSVNALKQLRNAGIRTAFKCIPTKDTINSYFKIKSFGESIADIVTMDMSLTPGYGGNLHPLSMLPSENQIKMILNQEVENTSKPFVPLDIDSSPCGAGRKSLCVSPEGEIYPCNGFPVSLGNIHTTNICDLWSKADIGDHFLAKWRRTKIKDFHECGKHEYCSYCPEVCAGAAWLATGDYLSKNESSCRQAKAYHHVVTARNKGLIYA